METRKLRFFVKLAEHGNFGRAADDLHIAQPALSQNIKSMEREFKVKLFHRTSKGAVLTEEGKFILPQVREFLTHADQLDKAFREISFQIRGELRVAYNRALPTLSKALFESFVDTCPNITVNLVDLSWTERIYEMVLADQIDVGVVKLPMTDGCADVASRIVGSSTIIAAIKADADLAQNERITFDQLATEKLIIWERRTSPAYYDKLVDYFGKDRTLILSHTEPDALHALQQVKKGNGVFLIDQDRADMINPAGIVFKQFADPQPVVDYGVIWKPAEFRSLALRRFEAFVN